MGDHVDQNDQRCRNRLSAVTLDPPNRSMNSEIEHERKVAILDLVENSNFQLVDREGGPYRLSLSVENVRLAFHVSNEDGQPIVSHLLSLTPFRKVMKDYQLICDVHRSALHRGQPSHQLQAVDMARRSVHNEASELLMQRLSTRLIIDFDTARRLFTLISVSFLISGLPSS
ncbi:MULTISPECIES: UPF0262 family protein [unclassified Shinella]|uniref:UPF0262 family protein n=1 Tax=unclassified Shinella TaxID=2643062 RepID=UPI00234F0EF6|nr:MULTISPECIES: UPF0262 family protein [unclassified Shinella]MCO5154011.1 UPF0262 family protein [Shinella sp.]MDC7266930.1 UPF0262 family protein [Shinella sp. HY16]MDC7273827.1 UPF0262 family protein [Shinella sp. YZ44]